MVLAFSGSHCLELFLIFGRFLTSCCCYAADAAADQDEELGQLCVVCESDTLQQQA